MITFKQYLKETADLEEGWKSKLAGAALAGIAALGGHHAHASDLSGYSHEYLHKVASGTHPRPMISQDQAKKEIESRKASSSSSETKAELDAANHGFSKEYLQKVASGNHPRPMISKEKAQELLDKHHAN